MTAAQSSQEVRQKDFSGRPILFRLFQTSPGRVEFAASWLILPVHSQSPYDAIAPLAVPNEALVGYGTGRSGGTCD